MFASRMNAKQDEGRTPGAREAVGIRGLGRREDVDRDVRQRLTAEGVDRHRVGEDRAREDQRRGLARSACDGEHRGGQDAAARGRQHDAQHGAPVAHAQRVGRFAQAQGDEQQHLLGCSRDQRQHDDRERERAGEAALVVADHEQPEDEQADEDRRHSVQQIEGQSDRGLGPGPRELGQIERDEDSQGHRDRGRHRYEQGGPDDRGCHPAPGGAVEQGRILRQEVDAEHACSARRDRVHDSAQHGHGEQCARGLAGIREPADQLSPAQMVRRRQQAGRVGEANRGQARGGRVLRRGLIGGAGKVGHLRRRTGRSILLEDWPGIGHRAATLRTSKRRPISCAAMFATSSIAKRIRPR